MFHVDVLIADQRIPNALFRQLLTRVSVEKRNRIQRFRFYQDAQNALLADVLVRAELCRITGLFNHQLDFSTNAYGKPQLNNNRNVHFNVTHSGIYVACAFDNLPVGIDVERFRPDSLHVAQYCLTPDENDSLSALPLNLRIRRFFEIWTKKESRMKWEGKGLSMPVDSFSVFKEDPSGIRYYRFFQDEQAIGHVCTSRSEQPVCRIIPMEELWDLFKD